MSEAPSTHATPPVVPPARRRSDLFSVFVLALTIGAVLSQVVLILWLNSR